MRTLALFTNSLTMARYYAARGIDYIHFHIDGDSFKLSDFDEIYPWLSGSSYVLSSDLHTEEELMEMYKDELETIHFLRRMDDNFLLVSDLESEIISPYNNSDSSNNGGILITDEFPLENLEETDRLIAFRTPDEIEPGIVDYETIDELLDAIIS